MASNKIRLSVQEDDIDINGEIEWLTAAPHVDGAVTSFIGKVRDNDEQIIALALEHYPEMTERALQKIIIDAQQRWQINKVSVIHRVGYIALGENIVFVGVSSAHRGDAFSACEYIMDYLKTQAPFWKKAITEQGEAWVEAKASDETRAKRWQE